MSIGFALILVVITPLVIGYLFSLKTPHRLEYDRVDMMASLRRITPDDAQW
jgi:hypothetical protein